MSGLLSSFKNHFTSGGLLSDPMVRLQMGAAMMGGQTLGDQMSGGLMAAGQAGQARKQKMDETAKLNRTVEFLRSANPELAQAVEAGALDPVSAYKMHLDSQKPKTPDFMEVGGQLFDPATNQWITPPVNPNDPNGGRKLALQGVPMQDPNGNWVMGQLSSDNQLLPAQTPEGYTVASPFDKSYGTSRGKELGEYAGNQEATASKDVEAATNALDVLDQIEQHPYLDRGVGGTSVFNAIPGTGGKDFQTLVDQAKSGAFLQAIQQMRGMGSLSNAEGDTATKAITSMDTATSKEAFMSALKTYRKVVEGAKARAEARMGGAQQPAPNAPPSGPMGGATSTGLKWGLKQ